MSGIQLLKHNLKIHLLIGLAGWSTSLYTLWHRSKVLAGLDIGESFCNLSSSINCDNVALSKYSQILGVSVPTYGLVFFMIVILLAMRALRQEREKGAVGELTVKALWITSTVGVLSSVGLGLLSMIQIGSFCLVCAAIYSLCLFFLFNVWRLKKLHQPNPFLKDTIPTSTFVIFAIFISAQFAFQPLGDFAAKSAQIPEEEVPTEFLSQIKEQYAAQSSYELPEQKSPIFAPADSSQVKVTLVEFSDFQCPHCAQTFKNMPSVLAGLKNNVRIIYKNFPLDPTCNSGGSHRMACYAARAARCVHKSLGNDGFKEMQAYLFENRESLGKGSIAEKAESLGLKKNDYLSCVESKETYQEIKDEIDLAKSVGIEGTPALFLNGKQLKAGTNTAVLRAMLKDLIQAP